MNSIPDLGLSFMTQLNTFCITATFNIEDTIITPTMLIIADKLTS